MKGSVPVQPCMSDSKGIPSCFTSASTPNLTEQARQKSAIIPYLVPKLFKEKFAEGPGGDELRGQLYRRALHHQAHLAPLGLELNYGEQVVHEAHYLVVEGKNDRLVHSSFPDCPKANISSHLGIALVKILCSL